MCCLLMDLIVLCAACLTVSVNCWVKQFAICLGVVVIFLLNECACCACDPIVPFIGFVYVFVCRKLSPHSRV